MKSPRKGHKITTKFSGKNHTKNDLCKQVFKAARQKIKGPWLRLEKRFWSSSSCPNIKWTFETTLRLLSELKCMNRFSYSKLGVRVRSALTQIHHVREWNVTPPSSWLRGFAPYRPARGSRASLRKTYLGWQFLLLIAQNFKRNEKDYGLRRWKKWTSNYLKNGRVEALEDLKLNKFLLKGALGNESMREISTNS